MKKGSVELGADDEEGESESKVINQIFGRLQHPKNEVRYLENICSDFRGDFFILGCVFHKSYKSKYHSIYKNKIVRIVRKTTPSRFLRFTLA